MSMELTVEEIMDLIKNKYKGIVEGYNWGERGLFYNPDGRLPKGIYFMTFKEKDGKNDSASNLNRGNRYRLNVGIPRSTFIALFGTIPKRPKAGHTVDTGHDFQEENVVMPHPVYGWMAWIAIINPTREKFESLKSVIDEAYINVINKWKKRIY